MEEKKAGEDGAEVAGDGPVGMFLSFFVVVVATC